MAVVTTKSTTVTNRDATPAVINDGRIEKGSVRRTAGYVTAVNGDSIASKYIMCSVPSTAIINNIDLSCAALTSGAANIGVSRNTADGAAVVSASLFAAAQSVASALSKSNVTNQSGSYTLALQEQPIWQAAGLSANPGGTLDIVVTLTAALTAGGLIGLEVYYTDNGT